MRAALLLALLALLVGCSPLPTLPAPGDWHAESLPAGVLAEADLVGQRVAYSPALLDLPPPVVAAVVLHEVCHLRGSVSEAAADCCAAEGYARLYGDAAAAEIAAAWVDLGELERAAAWVWCRP